MTLAAADRSSSSAPPHHRADVPSRALAYCNWPGCRARVTSGRCERHEPTRSGTGAYGHRRWRSESTAYLGANPHCACTGCRRCYGHPCTRPARHVDHVDGRGLEGPRAWDKDNWQSLCPTCHSFKTTTRDGGFGRGRRPMPPASPSAP